MRKIDLTSYKVPMPDGNEQDYEVKKSICFVLFHQNQKIDAREAIARDKLCKRIESADSSIWLEESDYEKIKASIESLPTVGRNDVLFVERILDAPTVSPDDVK